MNGQIFNRLEKKYVISKEQKELFLKELSDYLILDNYASSDGFYYVHSIYFDNEFDELIHYSIERPPYKEKLRVRSYNLNLDDDDIVYLEIKKKYHGVGNKRRIKIKYSDYKKILNNEKLEFNNYLTKEIYCEIKQILNVTNCYPKIFISCLRQAYYNKDNKDFRITFDSKICFRRNNIDFIEGDCESILDNNLCVMEIKFANAIPLEIVNVLTKLNIHRKRFSKYGKAYEKEIKGDIKI